MLVGYKALTPLDPRGRGLVLSAGELAVVVVVVVVVGGGGGLVVEVVV